MVNFMLHMVCHNTGVGKVLRKTTKAPNNLLCLELSKCILHFYNCGYQLRLTDPMCGTVVSSLHESST